MRPALQQLRWFPLTNTLKPGEKYCMMDSGAGCNAADAKKEFGAYRIQSVRKTQQCVLADGTEIMSKRICSVTALLEREEHLIPFEDLPVECPIISVRKVVKKGNIVKIKSQRGLHHDHRDQEEAEFHRGERVLFNQDPSCSSDRH